MSRKSSKSSRSRPSHDSPSPDAEDQTLTFEQSLEKLEIVVRQLEDGNLGLSEALSVYEQGVQYLKICHDELECAERRIELLCGIDEQGRPVTEAFDEEETSLEEKANRRSSRRSGRARRATPAADEQDDVDGGPRLF